MKKKVKCGKCGHEWKTKSKLILVTCPSCNYKVKNPNKKPKKSIREILGR